MSTVSIVKNLVLRQLDLSNGRAPSSVYLWVEVSPKVDMQSIKNKTYKHVEKTCCFCVLKCFPLSSSVYVLSTTGTSAITYLQWILKRRKAAVCFAVVKCLRDSRVPHQLVLPWRKVFCEQSWREKPLFQYFQNVRACVTEGCRQHLWGQRLNQLPFYALNNRFDVAVHLLIGPLSKADC